MRCNRNAVCESHFKNLLHFHHDIIIIILGNVLFKTNVFFELSKTEEVIKYLSSTNNIFEIRLKEKKRKNTELLLLTIMIFNLY